MNNKTLIAILSALVIFFMVMAFSDTGTKFHIGTTTIHDSTNYTTLNRSFRIWDSLMVDDDLIAKHFIYLDTNRQGQIYYNGLSLVINNDKNGGYLTFQSGGIGPTSNFTWIKGNLLTGATLMTLDSTEGLKVYYNNISTLGPTTQIKMQGDTASDYAGTDNITLNRQTGTLTTKSLTTAANTDYNLTFSNSLIVNNSRVFAIVNAYTGTGLPIVRKVTSGSGSATITIRNIDGAAALNNAVLLSVFLSNNP